MQVFHGDDDSIIINLTTEEAGVMVDLCFAGAFSDLLPKNRERQKQCHAFLWDIQKHLLESAHRAKRVRTLEKQLLKPLKKTKLCESKIALI
jgi:hypothetical protein